MSIARIKKGFTLIELLAVVAIVAILAIVVVLTINPAALLQQGRDATRVSDMGTLNKAVSLYYQDAMASPSTTFMGTSSVIYISIPDPLATTTAGDQCQGLGLPAAPAGDTYQCAASSTYVKTDGTGWIPINFNSYLSGKGGSVISKLPVDPINTTSTNFYYTYGTDGTGGFKLTSFLESQKYGPQMANDSGVDAALYEKGSNLMLAAGRGLMGYWNFDEGAGSSTVDASGNGGNGTWSGTPIGTSGYYSTGKVGTSAGIFDGSTDKVTIPADASLQTVSSTGLNSGSISAWINYSTSISSLATIIDIGGTGNNGLILFAGSTSNTPILQFGNGSGGFQLSSGVVLATSTWYFVTGTWTSAGGNIYVNGVLKASNAKVPAITPYATTMYIGSNAGTQRYMQGMIDDLRVYNYALSATQIQALYALEH